MGKRFNPLPPALKHGAYSGTALLPGEDPDDFKKLHKGFIVEFAPVGPLEEDVVASMARLTWRKQNLSTYKLAELAKDRYSAICGKFSPPLDFLSIYGKDPRSPDQIRADKKAAEEEIRNELGDVLIFVEMGKAVTIERLYEELAVEERLNRMIDQCLKRFLLVRGIKSISLSSDTAPSKRVAAS